MPPATRRASLPAGGSARSPVRSPSPRGRRAPKAAAAAPKAKGKPAPPRTPPVTDEDVQQPAQRGDSPATTAVSTPSSGWHATVGAAPQARGATAVARAATVFFMLFLIAFTPHVAMMTCARAARRGCSSCLRRGRAHLARQRRSRGHAAPPDGCLDWPSRRVR
jgi:hypothetical protein